jgi:hypothetical protein
VGAEFDYDRGWTVCLLHRRPGEGRPACVSRTAPHAPGLRDVRSGLRNGRVPSASAAPQAVPSPIPRLGDTGRMGRGAGRKDA